MSENKKERRPSWERRAIKAIMRERDIKYTEALRIFETDRRRTNG